MRSVHLFQCRTPAGALTPPGRGQLSGGVDMAEDTRRCPTCSTLKSITEFGRRGRLNCNPCNDDLTAQQREAKNAWQRQRIVADPEYQARKNRQTRDSNRRTGRTKASMGEALTATCRRCSESFAYLKAGSRARTLCDLCHQYRQEGLNYGITGAEAAALRARNACDICGSIDSGARGKPFRIDHCHETGIVRGLLCHPCNIAIGSMKDDPERLRAAADYVEKYRAQSHGGTRHAI